MSDNIDTPLNDDEIVELDDLLLGEDEESETSMTVDEAHGYLTALLISDSELLDEDVWLEKLVPDTSEHDQLRAESLLLRMKAEIEQMLDSTEAFEPLISEDEENGEVFVTYEGWCYGFMLAVSDDEDIWSELPKDEQDLLMPIAKLALMNVEEEPALDEDEYELLAELIPGAVKGLQSYWQSLE